MLSGDPRLDALADALAHALTQPLLGVAPGAWGLLAAALGVALLARLPRRRRRWFGGGKPRARWRARGSRPAPVPRLAVVPAAPPGAGARGLDHAEQAAAVAAVAFERRALLNREEAPLFDLVERLLADEAPGWRVMAQVSLGEIVAPRRDGGTAEARARAFAAVNAKRVDLAVFDPALRLALAIEYQGSGHYQGDAVLRDAIKREALRRAGVPLLEVEHGYRAEAVRATLRARLGLREPGQGAEEAASARRSGGVTGLRGLR